MPGTGHERVLDPKPNGVRMPVLLSLTLLLAMTCPASGQTLHYRAFDENSDSTLWVFAVTTSQESPSVDKVQWLSESGDSHTETYRVEQNGNTPSWAVSFAERDTDYRGTRTGDLIEVQGRIGGRAIDEVFEIDAAALYFNVALSISAFVRSDSARVDFWVFRPDQGSVLRMEAEREGVDMLLVGGVAERAIRVRWKPKGWRGIFYTRRSWYRASDGALLRTDESDGRVTAMVVSEAP